MSRNATLVVCGWLALVACSHPQEGAPDGAMASDAGVDCTGKPPASHLTAPPSCPTTRAPGSLDGGTADGGECADDEVCDGGVNGRCVLSAALVAVCSYDECVTDADCISSHRGTVCACRDNLEFGGNYCVGGTCTQDSDCGACGYCSPSMGGCDNQAGTVGYFCHTPMDQCQNDSDCVSPLVCLHPPTANHWVCGTSGCAG